MKSLFLENRRKGRTILANNHVIATINGRIYGVAAILLRKRRYPARGRRYRRRQPFMKFIGTVTSLTPLLSGWRNFLALPV